MLQSPYVEQVFIFETPSRFLDQYFLHILVEQAAHACLEFWYSIAHNGGVSRLSIKEEGEELRAQSTIWELEATDPESNGKWNIGRALVNANNLVVSAEKGEKEEGFAAIDDLFFKIDPEFLNDCDTMPPQVIKQNPLREKYFPGRQSQAAPPCHLQARPRHQVRFLDATLTRPLPPAAGR